MELQKLTQEASKLTEYSRLFFSLGQKEGKFDVVIRSVNSIDARTSSVTNLPFELLESIANKLLEIREVRNVYFDVTPKPPGTIEYVQKIELKVQHIQF